MQIFEFEDRRVHEGSHPPPWLARGRGDLVGVNGALQYVGHMSHYISIPRTRGGGLLLTSEQQIKLPESLTKPRGVGV